MSILHTAHPPAFQLNYFLGLPRIFQLYSRHTYQASTFILCCTETFHGQKATLHNHIKCCIMHMGNALVGSFQKTHCPLLLSTTVEGCVQDSRGHLLLVLSSWFSRLKFLLCPVMAELSSVLSVLTATLCQSRLQPPGPSGCVSSPSQALGSHRPCSSSCSHSLLLAGSTRTKPNTDLSCQHVSSDLV